MLFIAIGSKQEWEEIEELKTKIFSSLDEERKRFKCRAEEFEREYQKIKAENCRLERDLYELYKSI